MEQKGTLQNMHKIPHKEDTAMLAQDCRVVGQIQNVDKKSNACSLNQNIENTVISAGVMQTQQKMDIQTKSLLLWKFLLLTIITSQFSILNTNILIQYFSSKIQLTALTLILFLAAILYFLFIVSARGIQSVVHEQILSVGEGEINAGMQEEVLVGTVLKINSQMCKRINAKTKKVQFPNVQIIQQQCTQQTIKKVEGQMLKQTQEVKIISFATRRRLFIASSIVLGVFSIAIASINLFFFHQKNDGNITITLVLSSVIYVLSIGSCIPLYVFLDRLDIYLIKRRQEMNRVKQIQHQTHSKAKLSIEKLVAAEGGDKRSCLSIQKQIKLDKVGQDQGEKPIQQSENSSNKNKSQPGQFQENCKQLTKRSVLKSKVKKPSIKDMAQQQEVVQRRKVQINSKKIQYFEYAQISPSHSIIEDQQFNKNNLTNKYKNYLQKISSKQRKIQIEELILRQKIQARQKKVKSELCLTRKGEVKEEEGYCADYFC